MLNASRMPASAAATRTGTTYDGRKLPAITAPHLLKAKDYVLQLSLRCASPVWQRMITDGAAEQQADQAI